MAIGAGFSLCTFLHLQSNLQMCCPTWSVVTAFHVIKFSLRLNFLPTLSNFYYLPLTYLKNIRESRESWALEASPGVLQRSVILSLLLGKCICAAVVASAAQADAVIGSLGFKFLARTEWNRLTVLFSCSIPGEVSGGSFSALCICCGTEFQGSDLVWVATMSFGCSVPVFLCQLYP